MTNLLDLPLDQFRGYLAEGNYPQARRDELMRAYRAKNSLAGWLDRYGEDAYKGRLGLLDDGNMKVSSYLPVAVPKGMSIWDGLKSGRFQTRFKDYASDALGGVLNALGNPKASYDGTLPQADYDSAAMGTAGLAMGGGGVAAGRLPDGAVAANIPVMQGRSRQGLTDFFNPDGVSWGTDSKSTAEQFAGKDAGLVYKYNDEGKLEVSEADSYLPGQVYDLNYDLENPMQVPIKDTLWTREKELAKIAEAKAKGHDGLKIVHGTPDADGKYPKTDYVAFDPSQVSTVNANASKSAGLLAASIDDQVKMAKQKFLENPDDKILFHEYQDLSRKRLEQKDQSAVLKAENRIIESVPSDDVLYRGSHQPRGPDSEYPVRLDDISISTNGETAGFPNDFYGPNGAKYYAPGPRFAGDEYGISNQQSYRAIINARNNPDAEVTMYRAVPNDDGITTINKGDFVTLSPKYAEIHGSEGYGPSGNDAGKVISQKVKVKDLYFAGDDVNEFGYFPNTNANASKSAGLLAAGLPEPRNAGEAMAQRILEMRAAGKAGDVTDEMMAQADPQYMFNNTPLDMSEAARMARAEDAGFMDNPETYHGTGDDIQGFRTSFRPDSEGTMSNVGVYSAYTPGLAETYAPFNGGGIIPLATRKTFDDVTVDAPLANWNAISMDSPVTRNGAPVGPLSEALPNAVDSTGAARTNTIAREAVRDGAGSVKFNGIYDVGAFYKDILRDLPPQDVRTDFYPHNIRSRFARFDPEFSHLSNLSAANASKSAGVYGLLGANSLDEVASFTSGGKPIYHSGDSSMAAEAHKYGVEPQYGSWTTEIAQGASDFDGPGGVQAFLDEMPTAAWWSEQPDWIRAKVARAAGKNARDVNDEDIKRYGHLAIADGSEFEDDVFRIGEDGLNYGEGSPVQNLAGEKMKLYETPLYEYGDDGVGRYPFGIERNELVTRETIDPKFTLTGDALLQYMKRNNLANASAPVGLLAAQPSTEDELRQYLMQRGLLQ